MTKLDQDLVGFHAELHNYIDEKLANADSATPTQLFWGFVLCKTIKTQRSIILLCQNGLGQDAFMLERTLFELMVISLYIDLDKTGERLDRYMAYDHVTRKKLYNYVGMREELLKDPRATPEVFKTIEENYKEATDQYDYKGLAWSDKTIEEMAREINRWEAYKTVYKLQCILGHSEARSINEYVKEEDGVLVLDCSPNENYITQSLVSTFDFTYHIFLGASENFNWDTAKLNVLEAKYLNVVASTKPNPEALVTQGTGTDIP